jgi:hypothetical protein
MTAHVYDIHTGRRRRDPRHSAPVTARRPFSATIALFGLGLTPGFLLAAAASSQGGATMVTTALLCAGVSAVVTVAAALRSRRIAVRRRQRLAERARMRTAAPVSQQLRRAA